MLLCDAALYWQSHSLEQLHYTVSHSQGDTSLFCFFLEIEDLLVFSSSAPELLSWLLWIIDYKNSTCLLLLFHIVFFYESIFLLIFLNILCIFPMQDFIQSDSIYPLHNPTPVSYINNYQHMKGPRFIMLIFDMKLWKCVAVLFDYAGVVTLMFLWTPLKSVILSLTLQFEQIVNISEWAKRKRDGRRKNKTCLQMWMLSLIILTM